MDLQDAAGVGHEVGHIDDARAGPGAGARALGQHVIGRADHERAAQALRWRPREAHGPTAQGANTSQWTVWAISGATTVPPTSLGHRGGPAGRRRRPRLTMAPPVSQEPGQRRSDVSRALHGHPDAREVTLQTVANRRFDGVEYAERRGGRGIVVVATDPRGDGGDDGQVGHRRAHVDAGHVGAAQVG